jgi:hypothetical protein
VTGDGEGLSSVKLATEELDDGREFACDDGERAEDDGAEEVGVPGQGESGAFDDRKGAFDDDGVDGGDGGADDAEPDAFEGEGAAVEEDPDKEACGDDGAGGKDREGRAGVKEGEGGEDGEGEYETAGDLVEGCVDVFEGVIRRACGGWE